MAESDFDCYLCGTSNDPDAASCINCNGQLLKLPVTHDDFDDSVEPGETSELDQSGHEHDVSSSQGGAESDFDNPPPQFPKPEPTDDSAEPEPAKKSMKQRLKRSIHTSFEDQRLSDALGLSEDVDELDRLNTDVTSIPRARPAENIPILGTQPVPEGSRTQFTDDDQVSKAAYVMLAILILATVWLGYDTVAGGNDAGNPDTIAFADSTTTAAPTTTTTAAPDMTWSLNEIEFQYGRPIVRIVPYTCNGNSVESVGEPMIGVALDTRSVILPSDIPAGTNVVQIVTRTGSTRVGLVGNEGGIAIATSNVLSTRNLGITEISSEPFFYVGYDATTNTVTAGESPHNLDAEISASRFGELHEVRIGSTVIPGESLVNIDRSIEVAEGATAVARGTACQLAAPWEFSTPEGDVADEENEDGADLEEADAN